TMLWYLQDPGVRTVIAYAEALGDVPTLSQAARLAREAGKSIIFVKAGRTAAGARSGPGAGGPGAGPGAGPVFQPGPA
ncbi:MAG: hypothetical protein WCZ02_08750, partial [Lysobacterales bacterium]